MEPQPRLTLIATYKELGALFQSLARGMGCELRVALGQEEMPGYLAAQPGFEECDAFLARSIVAGELRKYTDVPVVSVDPTAIDLLRLLLPDAGRVRRVLFFRYGEPLDDTDAVAEALGMDIRQEIFHSREDMRRMVASLRPGDVDMVIGGTFVRDLVQPTGMPTRLITVDRPAATRFLQEAVAIAQARQLEQRRMARLQAIFDAVDEGLLALDESGVASYVNAAAGRLLGIRPDRLLGRDIRETVPGFLNGKNQPGGSERGRVRDINNSTLVINHVPILVRGQNAGSVFSFDHAGSIQRAAGRLRQNYRARGFTTRYTFDDITSVTPAMERLKELARLYAATDSNLLIRGETGCGKELFAQSIHAASGRANAPFVAVNCAAIPEGLLESELFGYEEGAFTGARRQGKAGMFEMAHTGTIFLDEVGDLPVAFQSRLLRVLQEREVVRVGGSQVIPLDTRVICATHCDLEEYIRKGLFRADLYYRLSVLCLNVPPLRERVPDIMGAALPWLLDRLRPAPCARALRKAIGPLLERHDWPGNFRELFSVLERFVLLANQATGNGEKPDWGALLLRGWAPGPAPRADAVGAPQDDDLPLHARLRAFERRVIDAALADAGQDMGRAARRLGVSRMTLWRKLHA